VRRLRNLRIYERRFEPEYGESGLWSPFGDKRAAEMRDGGCMVCNIRIAWLVVYPHNAHIHTVQRGSVSEQVIDLPKHARRWSFTFYYLV
jgi:hypothetical protein